MKKYYSFMLSVILFALGISFSNFANAQGNDNVFILKGTSVFLPKPSESPLAKHRQRPESVVYTENFENGVGSWTLNGDWAIGAPTSGPNGGYNSVNCAGTNLAGPYSPNADEWMVSPSITIPNSAFDIKLNLLEWFNFENGYDNGYIEVSSDGGSTWTNMGGRTGNSGGAWRNTTVLLNAYKGQNILLAFRLTSDGSDQYDGWFVDNVDISIFVPKPVSVTMTNLNSQNFPFIYMNVNVDSFGVGTSNLTQANFSVFENGTLQTNYFQVTPPGNSGGVRKADIIFLMDNSGSMGTYQTAVANNVNDFVNNLVSSGIDFALGLCRYGDSPNNGDPYIEDNGSLTSDANYFINNVWMRNTVNGGTEPGYYAITQSSSGFTFRPGAQKIFIEITDETPNQGGSTMTDALNACTSNSITLFAITDSTYLYNDFYQITSATHGQIYSLYSTFDDILNYISQSISNSYVVQYKSSDPSFNGVLRNVDVVAAYNSSTDTAFGSYTPGAAPIITLTNYTISLFNAPSADNTDLVLTANVVDLDSPFVQQVNLYYKNSLDSVYKMIQMTVTTGNTYSAIVPANDMLAPGLDFYITATDGQTTSSLPSANPAANPFQIAVLPNHAPVITHTPVTIAPNGLPILINADVVDNTNYISDVKLFYRIIGQLIYTESDMSLLIADTYIDTIPGAVMTSLGLEYYIKATDNFDVSTFDGTVDNPHFIASTTGIQELSTSKFRSYNYPNPFSETTTIYYYVPDKSTVSITVYNMLGEKIQTIVNSSSELGLQKIDFSSKGLSTGMYYYSLMEQSNLSGKIYTENRKMSVVK